MNTLTKWLDHPQQIVTYPNPILRAKTELLTVDDLEVVAKISQKMLIIMHENQGVGLAAPQVNLPYRFFVMKYNDQEYTFVNPVKQKTKDSRTSIHEEGCLSLPGIFGDVERPNRVDFQSLGFDGKIKKHTYHGMFARITQHEIDHLDGILFFDHFTEETTNKFGNQII